MAGSQNNILIVEDDAMIRELYRTTFVDAGYPTQGARDAQETFKLLETFTPDVILLDVMLPSLSGLDILKELRTNPQYKCEKAKIILLTNLAHENLADLEKKIALDTPPDGYIIKADTTPSDVLTIVRSLLSVG